jgi:primosomal protein N''
MRVLLAMLLVGAASISAGAQSAWYDLPAPPAALSLLDVATAQDRALAPIRAVRVLHTVVHQDDALPPPIARFRQVLADLDRFEQQAARLGDRPLSLEMARTSTERDGLKDLFDVVGLRLRERKKVYSVELEKDKEAIELRKRLASIGLDVEGAMTGLNRGEAVRLTPTVVALPSPVSAEVWTKVVFERPMPLRSVFGAVMRDRQAALLLYGLTGMTPPTRAFLSSHPDLLQHFHRDVAGVVAAFGSALRIDGGGQIVVPGGAENRELWEALVDERLDEPEKFARRLFERDNGRLAYFLDTIGRLDRPHQAFALGLWLKDRGVRVERLKALYHVFADFDPQWSVTERPFSKPLSDPATLLAAVHVGPQGDLVAPAFRKLWAEAFDGIDIPGTDARLKDPAEDGVADAAWLAEHLSGQLAAERRVLRERFLFGQRVFRTAGVGDLSNVLVSLRGVGRFPAVMAVLERMGITRPETYAAVVRRALALEQVDSPRHAVPVLTQYQAGLALIDRGVRTGAFAAATADALVSSLTAVPLTGNGYEGGVLQWLDNILRKRLPGGDGDELELRMLQALAESSEAVSSFEWEGAAQVTDVGGTSLAQLQAVRAKQGGNRVDMLLAVWREVTALRATGLTPADVKTHALALGAAGAKLAAPRAWPDVPEDLPEAKKIIEKSVKSLSGITKAKDVAKAAREVEPVTDLVDFLLGETLTALVYVPVLGDPAGLIGPASDVSHRHDFGLIAKPGMPIVSRRTAWQRPANDSADGAGQSLKGSLLGADIALAKKQLRRLSTDRVPSPRLDTNEIGAFIETVALTNPAHLTSSALVDIGRSVGEGRARIAAAAHDANALDRLAEDVAMTGNRRQLVSWVAQSDVGRVEDLFATSELFWLGTETAEHADLSDWGTSALAVDGCFCKAFAAPGAWDWLSGRPGSAQLATAVSDLNLRVSEHMAALKVPAALFTAVLGMATQDFIDNARPIFDDDWLGIVAYAGRITREQVEDYVAALVASGPVRQREPATAAGK